jgi:hypothetical protein
MLPDFLIFKRRLAEVYAQRVAAGGGLVDMIQRIVLHEGEGFVTIRADGSRSRTGMVRLGGSVEVTSETIRTGDQEAVQRGLSALQSDLAGKQDRLLLEAVGAAADSVGNVVHADGKPLTPELILSALEKVELQFNADGSWDPHTWVLHPSMEPAARKAWDRISTEPDLKQRMDDILERGRKAWRDRESNRKLVD